MGNVLLLPQKSTATEFNPPKSLGHTPLVFKKAERPIQNISNQNPYYEIVYILGKQGTFPQLHLAHVRAKNTKEAKDIVAKSLPKEAILGTVYLLGARRRNYIVSMGMMHIVKS